MLDSPLPPKMRHFECNGLTYRLNGDRCLSLKEMALDEYLTEIGSKFPRSLEHLPQHSSFISLRALVKYCPNIRSWHTRFLEDSKTYPQWSYEQALEAIEARRGGIEGSGDEGEEELHLNKLEDFEVINGNSLSHICFYWGSLFPQTLKSYYGPIPNERVQQLVIASGIRLQRLQIPWTFGEHCLSYEFLEYVGRSLVHLYASCFVLGFFTPEFLDRKPMLTFNSQFETLGATFSSGSWGPTSSKRFWRELPLPPSCLAILFSGQSEINAINALLYADWSAFKRLEILRLSFLPLGNSFLGGSVDEETTMIREEEIEPRIDPRSLLELTRFEAPGSVFLGISSLPPTLKNLHCYFPISLSAESVAMLPRGLKEADLKFSTAAADLYSWTKAHWRNLPPKLVRLVLIGGKLDPSDLTSSELAGSSFTSHLPPTLLAVHFNPPVKGIVFETPATRASAVFFSEQVDA